MATPTCQGFVREKDTQKMSLVKDAKSTQKIYPLVTNICVIFLCYYLIRFPNVKIREMSLIEINCMNSQSE